MKCFTLALSSFLLLIAQQTSATTLKLGEDEIDAGFLIRRLINPGSIVTFSNASISDPRCMGTFFNGSGIFNDYEEYGFFDKGVILATGLPENAVGPNDSDEESHEFGTPGDDDLDGLLGGDFETYDACVLEFKISCPDTTCKLEFNYVFGSEEYLEWVGSEYNDVFGLFVDNENIAVLPDSATVVSINSVNQNSNTDFFLSNEVEGNPFGGPYNVSVDLQGDGFTTRLGASTTVDQGQHTVKFAVADAGDGVYDSWIFLEAGTLQIASADAGIVVTSFTNSDEVTISENVAIFNADDDLVDNVPGGDQVLIVEDDNDATVSFETTFTTLSFSYSSFSQRILLVSSADGTLLTTVFLPATENLSCDPSGTGTLCDWKSVKITLPGIGATIKVVAAADPSPARGRALQSVQTFAFTSFQLTPVQTSGGSGGGDPHFLPWGQTKRYSFHGECDLLFLHSGDFHGKGLDIHLRTTLVEAMYSFVEAAVVRVGDATIEFHMDKIILNGDEVSYEMLPLSFGSGGYDYKVEPVKTGKGRLTHLVLNKDSYVVVKNTKKFMTVSLSGSSADFGSSQGLLGEYHTGKLLGRHGQLITDTNEFGLEWQVRPEETLFAETREPQLPYERCRMPTESAARATRRRLRSVEGSKLYQQASDACSGAVDFELCMHDVVATGEVDLADMFF